MVEIPFIEVEGIFTINKILLNNNFLIIILYLWAALIQNRHIIRNNRKIKILIFNMMR